MNAATTLLHNARLCTLAEPDGYGVIDHGALVFRGDTLLHAGPFDAVPAALAFDARIDAGGALVTPGLIDCHTHLVFAGDRAHEFELRLQGADYEQIARAGGGILSTVRATRAADDEALLAASLPRAQQLLADGVTTVEIKSGYGLTLESEARMLRTARRIGDTLGIGVCSTFLGAHALPPEFAGEPDRYIDALCDDWLPTIADAQLADAVDAFCEGIGFSPAQTRRVFERARALGLPVKLHADQLSDLDGAALVAGFDGLSADHIEFSNDAGIARMAAAGTVAVLLPGAFYALRETRLPPIESLRRHRVPIAVATDMNPGTSPLGSLRLALGMACTLFRLTPEEALRGVTAHAARALGLSDRGRLAAGMRADFVLWPFEQPAELAYWIAGRPPLAVYAGGRLLFGAPAR